MLHLTSNAGANRRPLNPVTVRFAVGEIQFVNPSGCVLIALTSHHFDLEGYPRSDHACRTITWSGVQLLVVARVMLLTKTPESREGAGT
jgi:hypothetical protein